MLKCKRCPLTFFITFLFAFCFQGLIKHGEASASVEIHIYNGGEDAYEPETYGHEIVVVRNIGRSGASKYKLKSANGTIVSASKSELEKMMFYMNIQVDNPVCILNQEAARSFLKEYAFQSRFLVFFSKFTVWFFFSCSSNPKKNYQLFMRATQLQLTLEKLNECALLFDEAMQQFDYQTRANTLLKNQLAETKASYERLQATENVKVKKKHFRFVFKKKLF